MRIAYILNQRFPTEKAYGIQVTSMCRAFQEQGHEVALFVPTRKNTITSELIPVKRIQSPDWYWPGMLDRAAFHIKNWISARRLVRAARAWHPDVVYTRDASIAPFADVVEAHRLMRPHRRMIAISQGLKDVLVLNGANSDNVLVAHDGVNLDEFDVAESQEECRIKLCLPAGRLIIGYVGQLRTLGMEKGIGTLIQAFQKVSNALLLIVGGAPDDISYYRSYAMSIGIASHDIMFTGRVPHSAIPQYLKACDVLTMPFPALDHYARIMSPLKLFEYMAAKRPIIATDLPSIREVLNEHSALLVTPGDARVLAEGIILLLSDHERSKRLSAQAFADVQDLAWSSRARSILNFIHA